MARTPRAFISRVVRAVAGQRQAVEAKSEANEPDVAPEGDEPSPDVAPYLRFAPPGHFYSPIPLLSDVDRRAKQIFAREMRSLPGID
ncbi:MAG: hypothetical protein QOD38_1551, partial [Acidimicrobiaceae bacterium]